MQNQKTFKEVIEYSSQYLNEKEKVWLRDYMDAGEAWLAMKRIKSILMMIKNG